MVFEVGKNPSYQDLLQFAANILQGMNTGSQFKDLELQTEHWKAATQVLLTEKVDRALGDHRLAVLAAKDSADAAAAAALAEAKRMRIATWGLVVVTFLLTLATAGLVHYTRALVAHENPIVVTSPAPSK